MKIKGPNSREYHKHLRARITSRRRQMRINKLVQKIYAVGYKAEAERCEAEAAGK